MVATTLDERRGVKPKAIKPIPINGRLSIPAHTIISRTEYLLVVVVLPITPTPNLPHLPFQTQSSHHSGHYDNNCNWPIIGTLHVFVGR